MACERTVIKEFILAYKSFPCLWDKENPHRSCRETRRKAYTVLLEKYKPLNPGAKILDVKKKIENIRTAWRSVHKRVLLAKKDCTDYTPTLWYYDMMTFLGDVSDFCQYKDKNDNVDKDASITDEDESSNKSIPQIKKRRLSTCFVVTAVEAQNELPDNQEDQISEENYQNLNEKKTEKLEYQEPIFEFQDQSKITECQSFGNTIGLQMQDLDPAQRTIAQKLMSDIIFDGRLRRLTVNSKVINYHKLKQV